jgi:hypothetical protein
MRKIARNTQAGHNHALTAAIVMTAFSIEAFVQTLGPDVYGEAWASERRPAERFPVKNKLKDIGKAHGVPVDFGAKPWKQAAALLAARDALAHPKPEPRRTNIVFEAVDQEAAIAESREAAFASYHPMHNIDLLEGVAAEVEEGLLLIWKASGGSPHVLKAWGMGVWSVTSADLE